MNNSMRVMMIGASTEAHYTLDLLYIGEKNLPPLDMTLSCCDYVLCWRDWNLYIEDVYDIEDAEKHKQNRSLQQITVDYCFRYVLPK